MFRFTIRDVLWLVLAVALALSWQLDRRLAGKRLDAMQDERDTAIKDGFIWKATAKQREKQYLDAINARTRVQKASSAKN